MITDVLLITAIGMGLVFVVIILLWGMMELLVRVIPMKKKPEDEAPGAALSVTPAGQNTPEPAAADFKQKAAAAAVTAALYIRKQKAAVEAVRLALSYQKPGNLSLSETGQASNWQAVMRSVQRQNQTQFFTRTRRNVR